MNKDEILKWLERKGSKRNVEGLARYGIAAPRAFGVPVGGLLQLAKRLGKDHALAGELWKSGWYEARMLAAMVDDPQQVTRRQMTAWAGEFDTGASATPCAGICSTTRRSRGRRCTSGPARHASSSSGPPSR